MEGGPPCFPQGFSCLVVLWILPHTFSFAYRALTVSGPASQLVRLKLRACWQSATPGRFPVPVWALPRSLAATRGISVDSFSSGYLDVSVHRVPSSHTRGDSTTTAGFPHSEICGSLVTCTSPQLIAAYRVLLRLIWPRHPPYALTYLTIFSCITPSTRDGVMNKNSRFVKISF